MLWFVIIVIVASATAMFCAWRLPGLEFFAQDWLMRERGILDEPENIVIVAIDDKSIEKLGRFPWSRDLTAKVLNNISADQPKVIALDVLYSEPTTEAGDNSLAEAIKNAGNVVVGEQLIENRDAPEISRADWLKAVPPIENAASGFGHVNVETEADGAARELLLRLADDAGDARWALAVETIRVGDKLNSDEVLQTKNFLRVGSRKIPFAPIGHNLTVKKQTAASRLSGIEPMRMIIDFIGPTGSFAAQTYSFADVLDGKIPPAKFQGKYVLIGATAATLGDRLAAPFVHTENADGDQHGDLMPGVEILANEINTILQNRFYQTISDWTAAFFAALTALAVILLLGLTEGKSEAVKQIGALAGLLAAIIVISYFVFVHWLIVPPLVPILISYVVAAPLALLRRSLAASAALDSQIGELLYAENRIFTNGRQTISSQTAADFDNGGNFSAERFLLPRGLEWKTNTLESLARDLISRADFINSALRSIEDGLLIADCNRQIIFVNQSALRIFKSSEPSLIGEDLFEVISKAEGKNFDAVSQTDQADLEFSSLMVEQNSIEREIKFGDKDSHYYVLRIASVIGGEEKETLGIVATFSDVTNLRELQKTKNDVIALVTHELRTPLTAIQGMSEVLTEHEVEPEPRRRMLLTINAESKRLAKMINDYLDVTRIEAGAQPTNFKIIEPENLIDRALLLLEPLAAKREIKIRREFDAARAAVNADEEKFGQMLTNIVANAIKYSPPHTSITVKTEIADEIFQISVADAGYGISAEQLPHIFEKFYRAHHRQNTQVAGTGLGLSLAQEIAQMHGGRIRAESESEKGSIFTIYLPLSKTIIK